METALNLGEVVKLASEFARSPRTATLPLLRRLASLCACAADEAGRARRRLSAGLTP